MRKQDGGGVVAETAARRDVASFGQVFTPPAVVRAMLALRRRAGRVLEPSCGDGAFLRELPGAVAYELDPAHCPPGARNADFFSLPATERFDTIIGNPPYVRFQDILPATRALLPMDLFDSRSNLFLFFIEKCVRHLAPGGELIFITPRDFLKLSGAVRLNRWLLEQGSFTDVIELGDARVFDAAVPNCLIWRFECDARTRTLRYAEVSGGATAARLAAELAAPRWQTRHQVEAAGHLMFTRGDFPLRLSDLAFVKVGAVSGADAIYADEVAGTRDFVCSSTVLDGRTRRMIWCEADAPAPAALLPHRVRLQARRIRQFDDSNWWQWGRGYYQSERPRIYVNGKTRAAQPFFIHPCPHYDGAVLAVFPHREKVNLAALCAALNAVAWDELGFRCDGRFLFTQRSLENAPLPASLRRFLP